MAQAHTPGPWRAGASTFFAGLDGPACMRVYTDHPPTEFELTGDNLAANARLIAAAPDLLEALETALTMLDALKVESGRGIEWDEEDAFRMGEWFESKELDAMENMRAAIAKAKGGAE